MNYRDARPGKPGQWNGRKQRWRVYQRSIRNANRKAIGAAIEKATDERLRAYRRQQRTIIILRVIVALGIAGAVVARCAL